MAQTRRHFNDIENYLIDAVKTSDSIVSKFTDIKTMFETKYDSLAWSIYNDIANNKEVDNYLLIRADGYFNSLLANHEFYIAPVKPIELVQLLVKYAEVKGIDLVPHR